MLALLIGRTWLGAWLADPAQVAAALRFSAFEIMQLSSNTLKRNPDIPGDLVAMGKNTQMVPGDLLDMGKTTQRGTPDLRAIKSEANCLANDGAISRGRVTSRTVPACGRGYILGYPYSFAASV